MGTLLIGDEDTNSAKKRRQSAYRKDLQLQMREKDAARLRERYQGMNVNASGWLDPEKGPERLKPLGGAGYISDRTTREARVRPYHSLFEFDRSPRWSLLTSPRIVEYQYHRHRPITEPAKVPTTDLHVHNLTLNTPAGLKHVPLTEATATTLPVHNSVHQAYNFYATRDIDRPGAYGSIVQPLSIPYVDNRPIIMPGRYDHPPSDSYAKYNPFQYRDEPNRPWMGFSQLEHERLKAQLAKELNDNQRKMRREMEDERRRLADQENQARRRIEDMRREDEDRRRELERRRREAEFLRRRQEIVLKADPIVVRPPSTNILSDMDDTRRRLIDERRKVEEMLRAQRKAPDYAEVKILKRPPPPPTPRDSDRADPYIIQEFTHLKHKDAMTRKAFRSLYPDVPDTNKRLEIQQQELLRQQEEALNNLSIKPQLVYFGKGFKHPDWLTKTPTPFPHRLRERDRLYTTQSLDGELDRIYRRNVRREEGLDTWRVLDLDSDSLYDPYEKFKLRKHRPVSADTLADDTWMRPASVCV